MPITMGWVDCKFGRHVQKIYHQQNKTSCIVKAYKLFMHSMIKDQHYKGFQQVNNGEKLLFVSINKYVDLRG